MLVAYTASRPTSSVRDLTALLSGTAGTDSVQQFAAVVVIQPADCDGNLGFFAVFERPSLAPHIRTHRVLIQGTSTDTLTLRPRLPRALRQARIELLREPQRALLHAIGHRATPLLLLFDAERRLRYASVVPMTAAERAVQLATITPLITEIARRPK